MVITPRKQANEDELALGQLDGQMCEDFSQGVNCDVFAFHTTICVLHGVIAVAQEGGTCTELRRV